MCDKRHSHDACVIMCECQLILFVFCCNMGLYGLSCFMLCVIQCCQIGAHASHFFTILTTSHCVHLGLFVWVFSTVWIVAMCLIDMVELDHPIRSVAVSCCCSEFCWLVGRSAVLYVHIFIVYCVIMCSLMLISSDWWCRFGMLSDRSDAPYGSEWCAV